VFSTYPVLTVVAQTAGMGVSCKARAACCLAAAGPPAECNCRICSRLRSQQSKTTCAQCHQWASQSQQMWAKQVGCIRPPHLGSVVSRWCSLDWIITWFLLASAASSSCSRHSNPWPQEHEQMSISCRRTMQRHIWNLSQTNCQLLKTLLTLTT